MKQLLVTLLFLPVITLAHSTVSEELDLPSKIVADQQSTIAQKFVYAELVFQRNFGGDVCWVSGSTVLRTTVDAVNKCKTSSEALDALGRDGWELTTAVTRNFDGGFEIYYYLRKVVE